MTAKKAARSRKVVSRAPQRLDPLAAHRAGRYHDDVEELLHVIEMGISGENLPVVQERRLLAALGLACLDQAGLSSGAQATVELELEKELGE